jgi:transketolase
MRNHLIRRLASLAVADKEIFLLTGDLGYGVVEEFEKEFPEQFLNSGVAEQAMMGIAAGLANSGYKPWVYSIANFPTFRCLEQIRNDVCYHNFDVTIVAIGSGFSYGALGYSHFGIEDISVMRALPGMRVYSPANCLELDFVIDSCLKYRGPKYIRLDKGVSSTSARVDNPSASTWSYKNVDNSRISIFATGTILNEAIKAAELLELHGVLVEVHSVPFVSSNALKIEMLQNKFVVTVEEHSLQGGLFSCVAEFVATNMLNTKVQGLGINPTKLQITGSQEYLRKIHEIDADAIYSLVCLKGN